MCGRFKRRSDKQKVAKVFEVQAGLEKADFTPGDDLRPQSMQPVIYTNEVGERQIEMMRWGFKLPDRLLFNARSEGITQANFWKDAFLMGRGIAPGDAIFEWKKMPAGEKKPKYEITIPGKEPFGMAAVWKLWKNPKTDHWERTFAILTGDPNELIAADPRPNDDLYRATRLRRILSAIRTSATSSAPYTASREDAGSTSGKQSHHKCSSEPL